MNKNYRLWNNIIGWAIFAIATITYFASMQQTVSWWDCGEYISTTYKLEVSHPPGAPTFQILGRLFTLFAFGDVSKVAMMVNAMSALCSSFTILFLFWSLTILARKVVTRKKEEMTRGDMWTIFGTGIVGALAYTFSDTFWFSAVEGEVYAMSSLCTAVVFWMILRWEEEADKKYSVRWIILIAYIIGLSIGVHLLNLLTIPAIAYVIYYKKYDKISWKGLIVTGILSIILLALILFVLIPWTVELAGRFELFFVNSIGMPFNSGLIIYFILLFGGIAWGIWFTQKRKKSLANTIILCVSFLLIGYSSFFSIAIRANTNTPINMNAPSDALSFLSYLNRDQYGSKPLVYGNYYSSPISNYKEGSANYLKDTLNKKYYVSGHGNGEYTFIPGSETIFPRMYSNNTTQYPYHQPEYERWGNVKGTRITYRDNSGERKSYIKPTFGENLRYFFTYQCGHMYWRYLMWNFSGRQNDIQGHGYADSGNWITGFNFLDKNKVGSQDNLPLSMQSEAHNVYYMLPFILGIAGLIFYTKKDKRNSWVVFLLFFMTGLAITLYLNDTPRQPRERDYAYAGSFYAFSMWIGMGVLAIYFGIKKYLKPQVGAVLATLIGLIIPTMMFSQNWDDHDRSDNTAALDNGWDYLNSCPPNAILYTNGDNDTYSLWYAQEVEGIRPDVRVINWGLSGGAWYCHQQLHKINQSERLPLTLSYDDYDKGVNDQVVLTQNEGINEISAKEAIQFIDNKHNMRMMSNGEKLSWLPSKKIYVPVDRASLVSSGLITEKESLRVPNRITFTKGSSYLLKNELLFLDLLATNNWKRPICFTSPGTVRSLISNIDQYCHKTGVVYQFLPFVSETYQKNWGCGIRIDSSYQFFMNEFKNGNITGKDVFVDRTTVICFSGHENSMQMLAQALSGIGDSTRAIEIMDKWRAEFPRNKFPYIDYSVALSDVYFKAGDSIKGKEYLQEVYHDLTAELDYIALQSLKIKMAYSEKVQDNLRLLGYLKNYASVYKQEDIASQAEAYINDYSTKVPVNMK